MEFLGHFLSDTQLVALDLQGFLRAASMIDGPPRPYDLLLEETPESL